MAKKSTKSTKSSKSTKKSKKTTKVPEGKKMVAGRLVDDTPVEFEEASFDDFEFGGGTRKSSKYYGLVNACKELEDGRCVAVAVEEDEDAEKKRLNIAQVIYNKVSGSRKGYKYKVRLSRDKSSVVIGCFEMETEEEGEEE